MERPPPGIRAIFDQAREIDSPGERAAFLNRTCADAPDVRGEVEALLRAGDDAGSFLETPAAGRLAGELAAGSGADDTRTGPAAPDGGDGLDFLKPSDKPGSIGRLGHYEVQEVVGRGGMGVVLKAFDENLHRVVAVKVMAPQLAASATARRRFTREARAAAAVTHDHVVTIHAVEDAGPRPYIVMQYVAGASLQDRLDRTGPLQLQELLRIGMQTASGLSAAHAQGLVHRDVKPANILLENGVERVKITDFGLARAADDASLTQAGVVAGTPAFMSPEQAEGKPVDHRSDLFSLGSVLYAMCTGRPPFRAGTSMGVLKRVCEATPTPIRETNPEVPDWLAAVIEMLHAKDPSARFQSAAEVAEVLGRHLAQVQHPSVVPLPAVVKPTVVKPADRPPALARPGRRNRWAVAAAVLVSVLVTLGTTEATGVTSIRATVVRIFTPDGTQVVPVSREADPPVVANEKPGEFVLLGGKGVEMRKFDTLAEAARGASDGDTIEVRGNGPFVSQPINIGRTALTIRAGQGFRPVIKLYLRTDAPLVLEGLELQALRQEPPPDQRYWLVEALGSSLHVANCRFRADFTAGGYCIVTYAPSCFVRNCEFLCRTGWPLSWTSHTAKGYFDNCLAVTSTGHGHVLGMACNLLSQHETSLPVTRNTLVSAAPVFLLWLSLAEPVPANKLAVMPIRVEAVGNVFDAPSVLQLTESTPFMENYKPLEPAEAEALLRKLLAWRERSNCYAAGATSFVRQQDQRGVPPPHGPKSLADWERFWGSGDTGSQEGRVLYKGGNLLAKLMNTPEQLTPNDFRLRPDSAGYRAGKDGKDLGADIDIVGPGAAYERWKKTPEYQQWLKDSGQVKK